MSGFSDFSLGGSAPILSGNNVRWKPQKGKYRVTFVALPGIENQKPSFTNDNGDPTNPQFTGAKRLYKQGVGYFLDKGKEFQAIAGQVGKTSIATTICFWPTDANGTLDKARFSAGEYEIKTWVFSLDKYRQLEAINAEFPLSHHDLSITVTDPQFHKMSFAPCKDSLYKVLSEKNADHFNKVVADASSIHSDVHSSIGQDLTIEQVREKLSGEVGSPASKGGGFNTNFSADDILDDIM